MIDKKMRMDRPVLVGKALYARVLIRRKDIGTSLEQSERLAGAGVDMKSCNLSVSRNGGTLYTDSRLYVTNPEDYAPAFSTLSLLELLPTACTIGGQACRLVFAPVSDKRWCKEYNLAYVNENGEPMLETEGFLHEAAVEMVEKIAAYRVG